MGAKQFRRLDGIRGVGYWITFAGLQQASISWPDQPATRHTVDEFERGAIAEVEDGESPSLDAEPASETVIAPSDPEPVVTTSDIPPAPEPVVEPEPEPEPEPAVAEEQEETPAEEMAAEEMAAEEMAAEEQPTEPAAEPEPAAPKKSEAEHIREYLAANPGTSNVQAVNALAKQGVQVTTSQVSYQRKKLN